MITIIDVNASVVLSAAQFKHFYRSTSIALNFIYNKAQVKCWGFLTP